jgi:Flp pilus assembly protein TadG
LEIAFVGGAELGPSPANCDFHNEAPVDQTKLKTANAADQISPRAPQRRARLMRGQTVLEFAIVVPLFLLLVFATIDFGRLFYVQMTLQNAVRQAARYAITGSKQTGVSRYQSVLNVATQAAMGLAEVTDISVSVAGQLQTNCAVVTCTAGGPQQPVTISIGANLQLMTPLISSFFPNGKYPFRVSVTFQNEAFPKSQT